MLGKNAHAWPEVWFDGLGWVPFEPTPGRGAPGAEGYTGLPAAQDDSIPQPGQASGRRGTGDGRRTVPPAEVIPEPLAGSRRPRRGRGQAARRRSTHTFAGPGTRWGVVGRSSCSSRLALLALPELVRRWRRRHPSADVARQIGDLWERALGAIEATGFRVDPTLTPLEQAQGGGTPAARWPPGR